MLVYLFSSNLSNPSTGGGISSDLCRRNSLGTSHSRHGSESEWPAVSSKRLESVKSHSTGLETKSSCGLDCENSPSTGLVYKWGGMEMRAGYSLALRTCCFLLDFFFILSASIIVLIWPFLYCYRCLFSWHITQYLLWVLELEIYSYLTLKYHSSHY